MTYDIFLSHASADKPEVEVLARRLREDGFEPFLDIWHLVPGEPWQEALEDALDVSRTCAVFVGAKLGPWQNEEMRDALAERTRNADFRVIPVLLPGALKPSADKLRFLRRLTWVDFRDGLDGEDAYHRLVCGIRGVPPNAAATPLRELNEVRDLLTSATAPGRSPGLSNEGNIQSDRPNKVAEPRPTASDGPKSDRLVQPITAEKVVVVGQASGDIHMGAGGPGDALTKKSRRERLVISLGIVVALLAIAGGVLDLPGKWKAWRANVGSPASTGKQVLHGEVLDDASGLPLVGALVEIPEHELQRTTGERGAFFFKVPAARNTKVRVRVSMEGFEVKNEDPILGTGQFEVYRLKEKRE